MNQGAEGAEEKERTPGRPKTPPTPLGPIDNSLLHTNFLATVWLINPFYYFLRYVAMRFRGSWRLRTWAVAAALGQHRKLEFAVLVF